MKLAMWVPAAAVLMGVLAGCGESPPPKRAAPPETQTACGVEGQCFPKPPGAKGPGVVGIPPGTTLTDCGESATITEANTVIDSCTYTGYLLIAADNVTIKNSRIKGAIRTQQDNERARFVVQDSELGPDLDAECGQLEAIVGYTNYAAYRNYLHGNGDGFRVTGDNVTVEDNVVVTCDRPGDHSDGVQGFAAGRDVTVANNTLDLRGSANGPNAPLFFADNSSSCICTDNLLLMRNNRDYALKLHDSHTPDVGPWRVTGNRVIGTSETAGLECDAATTEWSDNRQVTVDENYDVVSTGALVSC